MNVDQVHFDSQGLVPAIVQDAETGEVLTLAYMNRESLRKSLDSGETWFYSRSRQELWHKGKSSGNVQRIVALHLDCDGDALLVQVQPAGPACHTGERSCFHRMLHPEGASPTSLGQVLADLSRLVRERQKELPSGSYTAELFQKGKAEIARKVAEEGVEVAVASLSEGRERVVQEVCDLLYHLLVLLAEESITATEVAGELSHRRR